jgi:hypothetical protein
MEEGGANRRGSVLADSGAGRFGHVLFRLISLTGDFTSDNS